MRAVERLPLKQRFRSWQSTMCRIMVQVLDVYKRQTPSLAVQLPGIGQQVQGIVLRQHQDAVPGQQNGVAAVSYTHLDVYKRQGRHRISMVKDVRIFVNTIDHAIRLMTDNGVPATAHRCV